MLRKNVMKNGPAPTWRTRLAVLLLAAVAASQALGGTTGKISGRVVDAGSKEPLPGVNVLIEGSNKGASTDGKGQYVITAVQPGTYSVRATLIGYKNLTVTGVRVLIDATTELNLRMEETVVQVGNEIVITAERPLIQKDNTATRVFVENQEIENRPAANFQEVMTSLPSVNIEDGAMRVRGGAMNEVAFIIDGARARNPMNQTPYTSVNLGSIQEVEAITGTFNAEYGEARSGVFNIVTKEGGEQYHFYGDFRYTPPGVKHWGPAWYDYSAPVYWENSNARHLEWWIQYPDQWLDPNGVAGSDPSAVWTPEQAYQNYLDTHKPLNDYEKQVGYSGELAINGPVPFTTGLTFSLSGKYDSQPALFGMSYRGRGTFFNGTGKLSWKLGENTKLLLSAFYGIDKTSFGVNGVDNWYMSNYALSSRYSYFDYRGLPESSTDGETIKLTHVVDEASMYELKVSRVFAHRKVDIFPDDPLGWTASDATRDNLRAVREIFDPATNSWVTVPVEGGNASPIGYHVLGYQYKFNDANTDMTVGGFYQNQLTKNFELKSGAEFEWYHLDHYNAAKFSDRTDKNIYTPYQGNGYVQGKLEFSGFIMNPGLRYDFYNLHDVVYLDIFDPLNGPTEKTKLYGQFSPRLGVSHPIDEKTVLHFSYGHFFQRPSFGDYGEGTGYVGGMLTRMIIDGTTYPWDLGNRKLKPEKTIQYEVGLERNFFDSYILTLTGFYKDIRNTIRTVTVETPNGTYYTNGNDSYGDVKGFEVSLRKQMTRESWGTTSGYLNFTTQVGVTGSNGDPSIITQKGYRYDASGDVINHNDPRFKGWVYYETPGDWDFFFGLFNRLSFSFVYEVVFVNKMLLSDYYQFQGTNYYRPPDQNTDLRIRKDFGSERSSFRVGLYVEIHNLFNNQWLNLPTFQQCSTAEQQKFVESGFDYVPSYTATGNPILEQAKYRNLPRSIVVGAQIEL
jgi:outer membrane receptor protein involved in Fe transport